MSKQNQAKKFNDRYVEVSDIEVAGGIWNDDGMCFVFPDDSIGRFTDIRNHGAERDKSGNPLLRFVGGGHKPSDR